MEDTDKRKEEMASEFIVRTCQVLPKLCCDASDRICINIAFSSLKVMKYHRLCGSSEEFYIRPLNPCIADTDALLYSTNQLAFIEECRVLPIDVSGLADTIACYKVEPYMRYPGFVRLREMGAMNYNWKDKKFQISHTAFTSRYVKLDMVASSNYLVQINRHRFEASDAFRGPAIVYQRDSASLDTVLSVWCPQWSREAQGWPKRRRAHGWPTIAAISEVVQNGCHVVYVQHRSCRDDPKQWRLSFSIAEVILLQSWTQIQQIVYHLLRFFAKRELIQSDCLKEDEVLCTYHLKTLMLWTCEEMSPQWWNSSSVIEICCELLKKLSEWLKRRYYPNYFIPEANLFHQPFNSKMLDKTKIRLSEFRNSGILCNWFEENYILPFTRKHFPVMSSSEVVPHFMHCMLPLYEFRKESELKSIDWLFWYGTNHFEIMFQPRTHLIYTRLTRKSALLSHTNLAIRSLPRSVRCFTYSDTTMYSLSIAYDLGYEEMAWDSEVFAEHVKGISFKPKKVRCQYHIFPEPFAAERSQFQYLRAQDFMETLTGSNSPSEFQLLYLLAKEFLRKALQCVDSQAKIIAPAALVYLAALHFALSEYQIVIDLCSAVLMDQTTHIENETLNAGCLFFVDDVARIVGFCLLCKKLNGTMNYRNREIFLDLRLKPKVFAYYLRVTSAERISKLLESFELELPTSSFPLDQFFWVHAKQKCSISLKSSPYFKAARQSVYRRMDATLSVNSSGVKEKIIDILMKHALENMTSFYSVFHKDFGIQCNTIDCYRALYLYKCRQYDEVLHLCERIIKEPDLHSDLKEFAFVNILVMPPFDSFFDGDVQSLLGFHTLYYYLSHLNPDLQNLEFSTESRFSQWFTESIYCLKTPLCASLCFPYSVKCHYFLGRYFLARYMKLRCFIDCNIPYDEVMAEFVAMKSKLPFEYIIRGFLLQKLR